MTLLLSGNALAGRETARMFFVLSSIGMIIASAPVLATTGILTSIIHDARENNIIQTHASTPEQIQNLDLQTKKLNFISSIAKAATGSAIFQTLVPMAMLVSSYKEQDYVTALLSLSYFIPTVLNTGMLGWSIRETRHFCDAHPNCWVAPDCSGNGTSCSLNNAVIAWGVFTGFSYLPIFVPMIGFCCVL